MKALKFLSIVIIGASSMFISCNKDDAPDDIILQTGVKVTSIRTLSKDELKQFAPAQVQMFVNADVALRKAICTTTFEGSEITVSGLFIIPSSVGYQKPIFIYNHGTMRRHEAPTVSAVAGLHSETKAACLLASVSGCAVLMPDYVGYGSSADIIHPYVHAETLGQSGLDFIKAYREYVEKVLKQSVSHKMVIAGYSEGGYAAVALQRAIQQSNDGLKVVKTYAGAGPYDQFVFADMMTLYDGELNPQTLASFQWVLQTYKDYMGYAKPYNEIYSASDHLIFKAANYDFAYLREYPGINLNPKHLFLPEFVSGISRKTDAQLLSVISANSLIDFVPKDSLILFHSEKDAWVPVQNTLNTYDAMKAANAPVRKDILSIDAGLGHSEAATIFYSSVLMNMFATGATNE
jgi:pimeloyl-ACP methyl ester carboxylesterase